MATGTMPLLDLNHSCIEKLTSNPILKYKQYAGT